MKRTLSDKYTDEQQSKYKKTADAFQVMPKSIFDGPFPFFREPVELGSFSQNDVRDFQHDRSQLRFLHWPESLDVSFNMWEGYESFIQRDESQNEYIDNLLKWILENKRKFALSSAPSESTEQSLHTDFISWRGLLTKILCTPFEKREGWQIACILFNQTYYMCEFDTDDRIRQKMSQTHQQKVMTYGGYKFEQYLCKGTEDGAPDTTTPVNNKEAFCSVVRSRLKSHSFVYGAEVDCCERENGKLQYVELKTSREIYHQRQDENFKRFKLLKWWAQSFLIGIPKIVAGFRNDEGIVERLQVYKTQDIPKLCEGVNNGWEASVCFNFLNKFLDYVKEMVKEDNRRLITEEVVVNHIVWFKNGAFILQNKIAKWINIVKERVAHLFEYIPGKEIVYRKQKANSMYSFLPDWYCDTFPATASCNAESLGQSAHS